MKNLIFISVVLIPLLFACGERKNKDDKDGRGCKKVNVPASIETKFASLYPNVKEVEWEQTKAEFEAEFEVDEKEMSASFDSNGNLIETESQISFSELPATINEQLKEFIEDGKVKKVAKITDAKGVVTYEAQYKKDLLFDADGKMLNIEEENEEANVPPAVKSAFASKFKDVENVKWLEEDEKYEAEFEMNDVGMSANFDKNGNILETESEISIKELPAAINTYVTQKLSGAAIKEAAKITDAKGKITYEAEINDEDYIFDSTGNFIRKDAAKEMDEKEEKD